MNKNSFLKLSSSILLCFGAGFIGRLFVGAKALLWYQYLFKPVFTPPNWAFSIVWSIMYLLMGISLYMILNTENSDRKKQALIIFGAQLFLNALWTPVFFGLQSIIGGLVVLFLLWVLIFVTFYKFHKISIRASYLLIPYIFWVSFAMGLNISILMLNY